VRLATTLNGPECTAESRELEARSTAPQFTAYAHLIQGMLKSDPMLVHPRRRGRGGLADHRPRDARVVGWRRPDAGARRRRSAPGPGVHLRGARRVSPRDVPVPATGRQLELRADGASAVVTEVGASVRVLRLGGRDVLDGVGSEEPEFGGQGQALVAWPNRLRDGRYRFAGRELQLR